MTSVCDQVRLWVSTTAESELSGNGRGFATGSIFTRGRHGDGSPNKGNHAQRAGPVDGEPTQLMAAWAVEHAA